MGRGFVWVLVWFFFQEQKISEASDSHWIFDTVAVLGVRKSLVQEASLEHSQYTQREN